MLSKIAGGRDEQGFSKVAVVLMSRDVNGGRGRFSGASRTHPIYFGVSAEIN